MPLNRVSTAFDHIDATTLTTGGVLLAQCPAPTSILRIINDSDNSCFLLGSLDGGATLVKFDYILPNSYIQLDLQTNAGPPSHVFLLSAGDLIYVSSSTTHAGTISIAFYYQQAF